MTHLSHLTRWEQARYYLSWMRRHGFSRQTILSLPDHPLLDLEQADRDLLVNLINAE